METDPPTIDEATVEAIGVDLGIVNPATDNRGKSPKARFFWTRAKHERQKLKERKLPYFSRE